MVLKQVSKDAKDLLELQKLASKCDLSFKNLCAKQLANSYDFKELGGLYNYATSKEQKAYLDLIMAHGLSQKHTTLLNTLLPKNQKNPQTFIDIQVLTGNLIAARSSNIDSALNQINDYLDKTYPSLKDSSDMKLFKDELTILPKPSTNFMTVSAMLLRI